MRQLTAFARKEFMELVRTGKLFLLLIVSVLFGIMNPAIAKLTPWMMEMMADSLAESGMVVTAVKVDAMTSWTQFYKNIPMALVIFILMFSGILTAEYQKGTLINMLTKGMVRWKVILAKACTVLVCWSVCYWLCYGITYGYTGYFWDNSDAAHLFFAAFCMYLLGIWLISLIMLMSSFCNSTSGVLAAVGGIFAVIYLLGMVPKLTKYLPVYLSSASRLLTGEGGAADYRMAVIITVASAIALFTGAVISFNKKNL